MQHAEITESDTGSSVRKPGINFLYALLSLFSVSLCLCVRYRGHAEIAGSVIIRRFFNFYETEFHAEGNDSKVEYFYPAIRCFTRLNTPSTPLTYFHIRNKLLSV
ncbi:MAG: hypothetical protein DRI57_22295 [Deltaproteobacteria bacterium]|nr:MAG: hypothetical protein DRI57_22295 [Deltaproteobacteria bacterium]